MASALDKRIAEIRRLPLHPFTIQKMVQAELHREANINLSIHPRSWFLRRPDLYKPGEKQNTCKQPRRQQPDHELAQAA